MAHFVPGNIATLTYRHILKVKFSCLDIAKERVETLGYDQHLSALRQSPIFSKAL